MSLVFKPALFFKELEKKSHKSERTLRSSYYRAINKGLIELDDRNIPRLTARGRKAIHPYQPNKLNKSVYLLVIFDIPENERSKRSHLRALLRELSFTKVQQSVWVSKYDHRDYLAAEIAEYNMEEYVHLYEAASLSI